jgi:hypothetical protein
MLTTTIAIVLKNSQLYLWSALWLKSEECRLVMTFAMQKNWESELYGLRKKTPRAGTPKEFLNLNP